MVQSAEYPAAGIRTLSTEPTNDVIELEVLVPRFYKIPKYFCSATEYEMGRLRGQVKRQDREADHAWSRAMAFIYTTEYRLGRRGRINRSYTGIQALIAIAFDLALGFSFGVIGFGLWLLMACMTTAYRIVFAVLSLPFRVARAILRFEPGAGGC